MQPGFLPSKQLVEVTYADLSFSNSSNRSYSYNPRTANSMADYRGSDYGNNQTGVTEMTNISLNSAGNII